MHACHVPCAPCYVFLVARVRQLNESFLGLSVAVLKLHSVL